MKYPKHLKRIVAYKIANGVSQRQIAQDLSMSQSAVSRLSHKADVIAMIHEEEDRNLEVVKEAIDRVKNDHAFIETYMIEIQKIFYKAIGLNYKAISKYNV